MTEVATQLSVKYRAQSK
uniref:Uncharacterized protein n=1 Tax=Arundo donax TaxID=35708 RepID=A0A0A9BNS6_ARUDO